VSGEQELRSEDAPIEETADEKAGAAAGRLGSASEL